MRSRKLSLRDHSRPPLKRMAVPVVRQRPAHALGVALIDDVLAEPAKLLVGQRADVGRSIDDRVRHVADRREVGDLTVVHVVGRLNQHRTLQPQIVEAVVVSALHPRAVARVGEVAVAAAADVGRIVEEREAHRVVAGGRPRALGVALILLVLDGAQEFVGVEAGHIVFALELSVAPEEPGAIADDRPAERAGGVVGRERLQFGVLVLGNEGVVLEEVVGRPVEEVAARLRDHRREQPRRADVLGRNAAGEDLLFLDDLGVQVRTKRAGDRIGHVDAVEVIEVVARDAEIAADVAVVDPRLRRRVTRLLRVVGQHPWHELQVALVRATGRQRFCQLQGNVLPRRRAPRVDDRRLGASPAPARSTRRRRAERGQSP